MSAGPGGGGDGGRARRVVRATPFYDRDPPLPDASAGEKLAYARQERDVGRGIAYLLLRPEWVHRRVELITFLDAENVERHMSVDLTLPVDRRSVADMIRLTGPIVPLTLVDKRKIQRFSVWEDDCRPLAFLTRAQNGALAGACLVAWAACVVAGLLLAGLVLRGVGSAITRARAAARRR